MKKHTKRYNTNYRRGRGRGPRSWLPPSHLSSYEKSVWLQNSFTGRCVKKRENESTENLIRRFKRSVENAGVLREVKKREFYMTRSQKRRDKSKRALKRLRKRLKEEQGSMEQEEKDVARSKYSQLGGEDTMGDNRHNAPRKTRNT
jgi:small subunit ribosomal protein S21